MRSLVLGGSTFVGRRLVLELAGQGHEVSVLNRGRTPSSMPPGVGRFVADRTDAGSVRSALEGTEWDAIFDVSGFVMVAGGSSLAELLELFDGRTAAYVFVSSIMAYQPSPLMPWTEDQPTSADPVTSRGGAPGSRPRRSAPAARALIGAARRRENAQARHAQLSWRGKHNSRRHESPRIGAWN